jgi:hypothetical protein
MMEILVFAARLAVAITLFAAGVSKLRRLNQFRKALDASKLFSAPGGALVMFGVPAAELTLPIWLVASYESKAAAWAALLLLLAFTAYIFFMRVLKRDAACGCFGGVGKITDPMLARNAGLMALVAAGLAGTYAGWLCAIGVLLLLHWGASMLRRASQAATQAATKTAQAAAKAAASAGPVDQGARSARGMESTYP